MRARALPIERRDFAGRKINTLVLFIELPLSIHDWGSSSFKALRRLAPGIVGGRATPERSQSPGSNELHSKLLPL